MGFDFARFIRRFLLRLRFSRDFLKDPEGTLQNLNSKLEKSVAIIATGDKRALFAAVGAALSSWAKMEELLVIIAALLLRVDVQKSGLILYTIINFNVWINLIDEMFPLEPQFMPCKPRWNQISTRIRAIKDNRDRLAHQSFWAHGYGVRKVGDTTLRSSSLDARIKSQKLRPMDAEQITQFTEAVVQISEDLLRLIEALMSARSIAR